MHGPVDRGYMEAVRRITTPRLYFLSIQLFHQLPFSVPHLLPFINTAKNVMFDSAKFEFTRDEFHAEVLPRGEHGLSHVINVIFSHLEQVSSIAQIFNFLNQISSTIEHLTLKHEVHNQSSEEEEHNEVDPTEWHKLRRSFTNAKSLCMDDCLVKELSCSL
jgi:hypothetical protein